MIADVPVWHLDCESEMCRDFLLSHFWASSSSGPADEVI